QLIDAASMSQFLREDDFSRSPALQTAVAMELPEMDDMLRLTLRRRIPLPDVAPDAKPQPITIGGEARPLSAASIDILRWLFDHDVVTLRAIYSGLSARYRQNSIEAAIRELLKSGFLCVWR